jgi:hypothetical protein
MATRQTVGVSIAQETGTAWAQLDKALYAFAVNQQIQVVLRSWKGHYQGAFFDDPGVTCLAVRADGDFFWLAAGHQDGSVSLTQYTPAVPDAPELRYTRQLHDGPVTGIHFDAEEQLITGSTDRSVCVTPLPAFRSGSSASDEDEAAIQRLHLTLQCRGVRFDGVRTEREREKLRRYTESA